jgi:hypothetical protein
MKHLMLAAAMMVAPIAANAATLTGNFTVKAVNVTDMNSTDSQATIENFNTALAGGFGAFDEDVFTYIGDLDFRVGGPQEADPYSIGTWLGTGTGSVSDLDLDFADLQLSFPNINNGSAITTFFLFTLNAILTPGDFTVTHDDGIAIYDDGVRIGGRLGPIGETTTNVNGFNGGGFSILYVATNGNPSILEVDSNVAPVPLPAGGLLLLSGLGAMVIARRRRATA